MTRVAARFVGCKVSQADGEEALAGLAAAGLETVAAREAADVVVVHTCCVTAEAERKSRRLVRRSAAGGRRVVVAGCAAALHPEQFEGDGVTVAARPDWSRMADELRGAVVAATGRRRRTPWSARGLATAPGMAPRDGATPRRDHLSLGRVSGTAHPATPGTRTRLVLKVQDGCAGACAYCVVRLVRGSPAACRSTDALAAARARPRARLR